MIDLQSAECIVKAATRCREVLLERIAADPTSPIVPDLQIIADAALELSTDNERRTA
ncbi:hypothetical protein [Arthrobacter sp. PsM3]|uniref:hypothetical protein n=1 Tax=Arthrobacter sp. PsM3 TaxID=3030531 RepID=UPI00263B558F|nr:hypothetical protein [Arthrobacter sp. PsM3]MDN4644966.1 hypothetical protein [Arthrobacter sp. PsM3]